MLELNKLHLLDNRDGIPQLPEKCANLIISDPPYFECKGEFDFIWKSFDEYLEFMDGQAKLYKRILAENGTLFVYGHAKRIAYVQVIFDKYFTLENNLTWNKAEHDGLFGSSGSEQLRSFPPCTERILMYSLDSYNLTGCLTAIRDYIRSEIITAKGRLVFKDINTLLGTATNGGGVASACLSLDKSEPAMLTREHYDKIRGWLGNGYLRRDYEELRREFNNIFNLTEVLNFRFAPTRYEHDTVKPESLTRALILTCSREDDLVVVPFAGSGTECAMAVKEGRQFIGFEINQKYVSIAAKRIAEQKKQHSLFSSQELYASKAENLTLSFE